MDFENLENNENGNLPANPIIIDMNNLDVVNLMGLTKREYFSALCIQGILSAQTEMRSNGQQNNYFGAAVESIVSEALEITDELLKQLEK